jgi:hypothetical protein
MSAKELVLLAKQKYNALMSENHSKETVSVQTQADEQTNTCREYTISDHAGETVETRGVTDSDGPMIDYNR